jgi:hypothetical protein
MSYKSKHTGAQVDEAVSKVLSGDIEGSNIKEGSIPLSALSTEVKDKIENAGGYEFLLDIGNDTEEHIANWVKICNDSRFYTNEMEQYPTYKGICTLLIAAGVIKFEYSVFGFDLGNICVEGPIVFSYNDIEEFPKGNFIKTNVATNDPTTITIDQGTFSTSGADWNAKEGEAGYIKNKPFRKIKSKYNEISNINSYFIITEGAFYPTNDLFIKYNNKTVLLAKEKQEIYWGDGTTVQIHDATFFLSDDGESNIIVVGECEFDFELIIALSSEFISISDAFLNQALTNLGIDNTKYILTVAPSNEFNIQEFINKFGFIPALNDDGYGNYEGYLAVTNKELFLDNVLCCGFNTSLAKCIYVNDNAEVVFFFEEGLAKGSVKVSFAENNIDSTPLYISWEPFQ